MIFYTFFSILGAIHSWSSNCDTCSEIRKYIEKLDLQRADSVKLLNENQRLLQALHPNELSKKVKLSSNILILTSKVETLDNTRTVRLKETLKYRCGQCVK